MYISSFQNKDKSKLKSYENCRVPDMVIDISN